MFWAGAVVVSLMDGHGGMRWFACLRETV